MSYRIVHSFLSTNLRQQLTIDFHSDYIIEPITRALNAKIDVKMINLSHFTTKIALKEIKLLPVPSRWHSESAANRHYR